MSNIAVILSGGSGTRMGAQVPKQYLVVGGKPIISYCLDTFLDNYQTDVVVIVLGDEWKHLVEECLSNHPVPKTVLYAEPGETRQYSIFNALKLIRKKGYGDKDTVIIHDAARPMVSDDLINRCYSECNGCDGVMPVLPLNDTVYCSVDGKHISSLLDRNLLWRGQSPECFKFGPYLQAHLNMPEDDLIKINGSTELAFKMGLNCKMIEGDVMNFKITTLEDMKTFMSIVKS